MTYSLSVMEAIPKAPKKALPNDAYHLLSHSMKLGNLGKRIKSTIDKALQKKAQYTVDRYMKRMSENEVFNACALVTFLKTQSVLAYIGNTKTIKARAPYVDLIQAPRSSGSTFKTNFICSH